MDDLLAPLERVLGKGRPGPSGELNFCCPFCKKRKGKADTGYHLYVNPNRMLHGIRGWYYCQRCEAKGPLYRIARVSTPSHKLSEWDKFVKHLKSSPDAESEPSVKVEIPRDYISIIPGTEAYNYLRSRGMTLNKMRRYRIGFGHTRLSDIPKSERRYHAGSGRIIFPDFDSNGECIYWVARTYVNHKIRYKNPPGADARDKVYRLVDASVYEDVIITEGVMSAIAAGPNAVATYGKDVTDRQVGMLVSAGFDTYYVALDGDARKQAYSLSDRLTRRGCKVKVVELPQEHDPDSVPDFKSFVSESKSVDFRSSVEFLLKRE